jgi:hypothetical protein
MYVVNAFNRNIKFFIIVEVLLICSLTGYLVFPIFFKYGFVGGFMISFILGGILGALISIISQGVSLKIIKNKLNNMTPFVALSLDKDNYSINYTDLSIIDIKNNKKSFPFGKNELYLISAYGTYKYGISKKYVPEVKRIIEKIEIPKPKVSKQRKKLKLKTPQPDKN